MKKTEAIPNKIVNLPDLNRLLAGWRIHGKTVAFTNGVFDLLHPGHLFSLSQAAQEADYLVVAVNSDSSVKKLKGPGRPVLDEQSRALLLASLCVVDAVIIFEEDTPHHLIATLLPDVLVKGGDYTVETIVGAQEVIGRGGRVVVNPLIPNISTTQIIARMQQTNPQP